MNLPTYRGINGDQFLLETLGPTDSDWCRLTTYPFERGNVKSIQVARNKVESARATWGRQDDFRDHKFRIREL